MTRTILPIFDSYKLEGEITGRLVAGYGELEFELLRCLAAALDDAKAAIRVMYRARGEEQRLQIADALVRPMMLKHSLERRYSDTFSDLSLCRQIRNQYAHCHWTEHKGGLCLVSLEDSAKKTADFVHPHPILLTLLQQQEAFFVSVSDRLQWLWSESERLEGRIASHDLRWSRRKPRPALHSAQP